VGDSLFPQTVGYATILDQVLGQAFDLDVSEEPGDSKLAQPLIHGITADILQRGFFHLP
jgi:hypothetical protein